MPWSGGVYTRGYPSWSNDAASNLPISATKFDIEDNDFATGLNNCLTKDGLNGPSGPVVWGATAAIPLSLTRASDGTIFQVSRLGGSHNPALQFNNTDAGGIQLNLTTAQTLSLQVQGTTLISAAAGAIALNTNVTIPAPASGVALTVNGSTTAGPMAAYTSAAATDNVIAYNAPSGNVVSLWANGNGLATGASALLQMNASNNLRLKNFTAGGALILGTNTLEQFQINNTGNVLIGPPSSGYAVAITGVSGNHSTSITDSAATAYDAGYLDTPQLNISGSLSLALVHRGKHIFITGSSASQAITIPANGSVAFPIGTTIILVNNSSQSWAINITTDTLEWFPGGTTGNRTFNNTSVCTLLKITATQWAIWGQGLS